MNLHIWHNESNYRKGIKDGNNLELTHGLNGIRNTAKNKIQETEPDYVLILPWNLKDEIIKQMNYINNWGGRFVIPIPKVSII